MAQRRMFSKEITESDMFLDMPTDAQLLYFHLGMQADDDGFVSPNRVSRMVGISNRDTIKILIAKQFVIPFEDGVVVIRHWKVNNYLRNDRYKATMYHDDMALLKEDENAVYQMSTNGIPKVDAGKVRIGKDSIEKDMLAVFEERFDRFWKVYPSKKAKKTAFKAWLKLKPNDTLTEKIIEAVESAKNTDQWIRGFIPHPSTYINQERWEDEIEELLPTEIIEIK